MTLRDDPTTLAVREAQELQPADGGVVRYRDYTEAQARAAARHVNTIHLAIDTNDASAMLARHIKRRSVV